MAPQMCHARVLVIALGVPRRRVWLGNTEKILHGKMVQVAQDSLCSKPMYSNKMWGHFLLTSDPSHPTHTTFTLCKHRKHLTRSQRTMIMNHIGVFHIWVVSSYFFVIHCSQGWHPKYITKKLKKKQWISRTMAPLHMAQTGGHFRQNSVSKLLIKLYGERKTKRGSDLRRHKGNWWWGLC